MKSLDALSGSYMQTREYNKSVGNTAEGHKSSSRDFVKPTPWDRRSGSTQNKATSIHPSHQPAN